MTRHLPLLIAMPVVVAMAAGCRSADPPAAPSDTFAATPQAVDVVVEPTAGTMPEVDAPTAIPGGDGQAAPSVPSAAAPLPSRPGMTQAESPEMYPDAVELVHQFNPDTAAGEGALDDLTVSIRVEPEGCVPPGGGDAHGIFRVGVSLRDAPGEVACAEQGETVVVNGAALVFGTAGDDILDGSRVPTGLPAVVFGFSGDDHITWSDDAYRHAYGGAGNDTLTGGAGTDVLLGGTGDDLLSGGDGGDFLAGGDGDDALTAGPGGDELFGEAGADTLIACPADFEWDSLWGGAGMDAFAVAFLADNVLDNVEDALGSEVLTRCDALAPQP